MGGPNRELAVEKYRAIATVYDGLMKRTAEVRREAVALMQLKPGDVVLDIGCGTGLSFPLIEQGIGSDGTVIGIDLSPEMLAKARERVESDGWQNVRLIEAAIEDAAIPAQADAVLFHFTHDAMRSPAGLENIFKHVKPGGRVVSAGGKWAPWWAFPVNIYMRRVARRYVTTFDGYGKSWSLLAGYVPDAQVKSALFGAAYIAWGTVRLLEH